MTIKEIIDGLQMTIDLCLYNPNTGEAITEPRNDMDKTTVDACKGAIEFLQQEPCEDAISRQAVLDLPRIKTHNVWGNVIYESVDVDAVRQLPSVTPQKKMGKWEKRDVRGQRVDCCSVCGLSNGTIYEYNYCPNCGAKMENEI